jgi:hypothetical protein
MYDMIKVNKLQPDWSYDGDEGLSWCEAFLDFYLTPRKATFVWTLYENARETGGLTMTVEELATLARLSIHTARQALAATRNLGFFEVNGRPYRSNQYRLTLPAGYATGIGGERPSLAREDSQRAEMLTAMLREMASNTNGPLRQEFNAFQGKAPGLSAKTSREQDALFRQFSTGGVVPQPLQNASHLRLSSEQGTAGSFSLEFSLIGSNNRALAKQTVALDLKPAEVALPGTGAATAPKLPPEEVAALLARGEDLLRQGGIAAARIIFENLAQRGYAPAAFALGRSYDPTFVPDSRISAPAADLDKALKWYQRAEELGNTEAREQIAKLSSGR